MTFDEAKDYTEWQKTAKAKLEELLGLPFGECEDDFRVISEDVTPEYRRIAFEFQSEEGYYLPCELLIPSDADGPLPVVICLQGHSSGKHISLGIEKFADDMDTIIHSDFALQAIKEGYCALVFDQRYMGQTGQATDGTPSCFAENRAMVSLLIGRTAIGERVWDVKRLIDVVEEHFTVYVDSERIICLGNSGGGTATFYAACLDERIHLAIPSCAICTFEESILPIHHCGCNYIPNIRKYFNMGDIGCLIAPRKLIQVNGTQDHLFWIGGARACYRVIQKAYRKMGCQNNCCMIEGESGHQFYPELVWPVVKKMME